MLSDDDDKKSIYYRNFTLKHTRRSFYPVFACDGDDKDVLRDQHAENVGCAAVFELSRIHTHLSVMKNRLPADGRIYNLLPILLRTVLDTVDTVPRVYEKHSVYEK